MGRWRIALGPERCRVIAAAVAYCHAAGVCGGCYPRRVTGFAVGEHFGFIGDWALRFAAAASGEDYACCQAERHVFQQAASKQVRDCVFQNFLQGV